MRPPLPLLQRYRCLLIHLLRAWRRQAAEAALAKVQLPLKPPGGSTVLVVALAGCDRPICNACTPWCYADGNVALQSAKESRGAI